MKIEELLRVYKVGKITFETYCKLLILQDCASYMFEGMDFTEIKLQGLCDFELKLTKKGEELLAKCGKPVKLEVDFVKLLDNLKVHLKNKTGKTQVKGYGDRYFMFSSVNNVKCEYWLILDRITYINSASSLSWAFF